MAYKKGPWTILSSKKIYRNKWLEVVEDRVIKPKGGKSVFCTITAKTGVAVLPVDTEGNLYLVKQYRYALGKETIEVVTGGVSKDETILDAAKRELLEESGIKATDWKNICRVNPFPSIINSDSHLFIARNLCFSKGKQDDTEDICVFKTTLTHTVDLVQQGKITHPATIILVFSLMHGNILT